MEGLWTRSNATRNIGMSCGWAMCYHFYTTPAVAYAAHHEGATTPAVAYAAHHEGALVGR